MVSKEMLELIKLYSYDPNVKKDCMDRGIFVLRLTPNFVEVVDGHNLIRRSVSPQQPEEFPQKDKTVQAEPITKEILLDGEGVEKLFKSFKPCKSFRPILANLGLIEKEDHVELHGTDLQSWTKYEVKKVEMEFPDTDRVVRKALKETPLHQMTFAVPALMKVLEICKNYKYIKFIFPNDDQKAVIIWGKKENYSTGDYETVILLMPSISMEDSLPSAFLEEEENADEMNQMEKEENVDEMKVCHLP